MYLLSSGPLCIIASDAFIRYVLVMKIFKNKIWYYLRPPPPLLKRYILNNFHAFDYRKIWLCPSGALQIYFRYLLKPIDLVNSENNKFFLMGFGRVLWICRNHQFFLEICKTYDFQDANRELLLDGFVFISIPQVVIELLNRKMCLLKGWF